MRYPQLKAGEGDSNARTSPSWVRCVREILGVGNAMGSTTEAIMESRWGNERDIKENNSK